MIEVSSRLAQEKEVLEPHDQFGLSRSKLLPEPTDPLLLERYISLQAGELTGNDSVSGGLNDYYMREKFTGRYTDSSLDDLIHSYQEHNERFNGRFRACGRFDISSDELRGLLERVEKLQGAFPVELEYYYETKSGNYKVGIGINGPERYAQDYFGAARSNDPSRRVPPISYSDLVALQERNYGRYYYSTLINPEVSVLDNTRDLTVDQRYQLAILYLEAFGPGWSYHSVEHHDHVARPIRIGVLRGTGEVVAACLADSDEHTIEFTEWVAKRGIEGAAVMIGAQLIDACIEQFPDKVLYGEFRTTSAAATQALRMGFAIPQQLSDVSVNNLIKANVKVEGEITDFTPLIYSYDFSRPLIDDSY